MFFLPFEINSVTMKNTTIFTVTDFCKMNSFRVGSVSQQLYFPCWLIGRETDLRTQQFQSIFPRTCPLYSEKAVCNTAGFKAIPTHLSVPLRHSGGGLLWFKSLIQSLMSLAICRTSKIANGLKKENITYTHDKTDQHGIRINGKRAWRNTCNAYFLNEKIPLSRLSCF